MSTALVYVVYGFAFVLALLGWASLAALAYGIYLLAA